MSTPQLPYRPCVGIILTNGAGQVWVGQRIPKIQDDSDAARLWQMPQGGIDEGEDPEIAARRELREETGVTSVTVLGRTADWLRYDLPEHLQGVALKGRFKGQAQLWFAMRFDGAESEFDLGDDDVAEFDAWEWVTPQEAIARIVPFKRDVYTAAFEELGSLL